MRRIGFGLVPATAMLLVAALSAQSRPNFTGTWVREELPPPPPPPAGAGDAGRRAGPPATGGAGFNCSGTCTIGQDANSLKVDRPQGNQTFSSTYKLDGTDSKNQMPGQGGMTDVVTAAKWDGNRITFTTKRQIQGTTVTSVQTLSMVGATMVVESSIDRGQGAQPGLKLVYKKQ